MNPRSIINVLALLTLFVLPILLHAQSPIVLTTAQDIYPLGTHLEYLEDKEKSWTIEDVTSSELSTLFVPSTAESPGFGFTDSAIWVRFPIRNAADETVSWLLVIDSYLFYIDVYMPTNNPQGFELFQTGSARPYDSRPIDHPRFLFDLSVPPDSEETIYIRFESESSMSLSLAVWTAGAVAQNDLLTQMLNGFLYGVLLIMAAYNFLLFVALRDRNYIYFVLFLVSFLVALLINDSIAHKYIWPEQGRINAIGGQFAFTFLLIFLLLFTDSFLRLKQYAPRLRKILIGLIVALFLMLPLQWISLLWTARPVLLLTIATSFIVLSSGFIVWRKNYRPARYFMLAWLLLVSSFVIFVLSLFEIIPLTLFSTAGTQIGVAILVLTLSLALADRIKIYRSERDEAKEEIIQRQEENLRQQDEFANSLQNTIDRLEKEFEERTLELSFAQEQIDSLFENSPLAIGTASMDGRVLSANSAMKTIFGYPDNSIFEANVVDFFPDDQSRQEIINELLEEGFIHIPMLQLKHSDGGLIYVNLTQSILSRGDQDVLLGIVDDITDQVLAEQTLQKQVEETAVTDERNRIARELHDSVTQTLYTTSLIAEALPKVWHMQPEEALRGVDELRILTRGALAEMRTLLLELRPGDLAGRSLSELLHQLTDAMTTRTELPITTTIVGGAPLPTDVKIAFYRITQEALNNISKHARADRAWVNFSHQNGRVTLRIGDNGRGFQREGIPPHRLGLNIMQERANAIHANLKIDTDAHEGTEIIVVWQKSE